MVVVLEVGSRLVSFWQNWQGRALFLHSKFLHTSLHQPVCVSGWACIDPVMLIMGETEKPKSRYTELPLKLEPTPFQRGYCSKYRLPSHREIPAWPVHTIPFTRHTTHKAKHCHNREAWIPKQWSNTHNSLSQHLEWYLPPSKTAHHLEFLEKQKALLPLFGKTTLNVSEKTIQHKQIQWFSDFLRAYKRSSFR